MTFPFFKKLHLTGTTQLSDSLNISRIILVNKISLLFFYVSIPWFFIFSYVGLRYIAWSVLPFSVLFLSSIFLNGLRKYDTSKYLLIIAANCALLFYSSTLGKAYAVQYILLPISVLPFILFPNKRLRFIIFMIFASVWAYWLLELSNYESIFMTIHYNIPSKIVFVIRQAMVCIAFVLLLGLVSIFYRSNNELYHEKIKLIEHIHDSELTNIKKAVGTFAHNINNILTPILMDAHAIQSKSTDTTSIEHAKLIHQNGKKITRFIKKMSHLKEPKDMEYANGKTIIDLENSIYDDD